MGGWSVHGVKAGGMHSTVKFSCILIMCLFLFLILKNAVRLG